MEYSSEHSIIYVDVCPTNIEKTKENFSRWYGGWCRSRL